jgi:hypothetical protein
MQISSLMQDLGFPLDLVVASVFYRLLQIRPPVFDLKTKFSTQHCFLLLLVSRALLGAPGAGRFAGVWRFHRPDPQAHPAVD